jgi:hypothetical protein
VHFLLFALLLAPQAPAPAPRFGALFTCNGEIVSSINIHSYPPGSTFVQDAWLVVGNAAGIHHVATRPEVIQAYLRLQVGSRCAEVDRRESERLLRAQRFIASATVRAVPVGEGRVRIDVEVVDDLSPIVGGSLRGASVASVLLGVQNLDGRGLIVEASGQRGFGYRTGFGGDVVKYGAFHRPFTLALGGEIDPLGDAFRFEFSKPFLTDLQPNGFHVGISEVSNYYDITRPTGDDVFLNVRRANYDIGVGSRVARLNDHGAVGVLGALLMGQTINTAQQAVFMTDSGLVAAPGLPEVNNRYSAFSVVRAGLFGGIRALTFTTVRGFDAVTAAQDLGRGVELGVFVSPSIWETPHTQDYLLSSELYAGIGNPESFLEVRLLAEGRANRTFQQWDGIVGFGKLAWYVKPSEVETRVTTFQFSQVQRLVFPLQLGFFDDQGGLPGFNSSEAVGGKRAVVQVEERRVVKMITSRADFAVAGFVAAGKIWAGDVPYGQNTPVRASIGVSLLTAYPAGSKRTYRVDFAVPINPDGAKFQIRFSSSDETRSIWRQPNDIAGAHSGAILQNLGSWSPR